MFSLRPTSLRFSLWLVLLFCSPSAQALLAQEEIPQSQAAWEKLRDGWLKRLNETTFSAWPDGNQELKAKPAFNASQKGVGLRAIDFQSDEGVELRLYISHYPGLRKPDLVVLNVLDAEGWQEFLAMHAGAFEKELGIPDLPEADEEAFQSTRGMFRSFKWAMAYIAPRGVIDAAGKGDSEDVQLNAQQVWDIRCAIQCLRDAGKMAKTPVWLQSSGPMAAATVFASLYEPDIARLDLYEFPDNLDNGPPGAAKILDMPQVLSMAVERTRVILYESEKRDWGYAKSVPEQLGWDRQLGVRAPPPQNQ